MARRLATTVLAVFGVVSCDALGYPSDNSLRRFREDPLLHHRAWGPISMLSGNQTVDDVDLGEGYIDSFLGEDYIDYLYPWQAERDFTGPFPAVARSVWWLCFVAAVPYILAVRGGMAIMKDRKPFDLRGWLVAWNFVLAAFSIMGTLRMVPHLFMLLYRYGFEYTVCRAAMTSYGHGAPALWTTLFVLSKYAELIDTAFLVLRKKPVSFLHWYHHASVLIYCWNAYCWEMPTGIYFTTMNFSVHAVMYSYYLLAAVCKQPPKWGLLVTVLQLVQMALGISVSLAHLNYMVFRQVPNCDGHLPNLFGALAMYASYFALFAHFFFCRYCVRRSPRAKKVE